MGYRKIESLTLEITCTVHILMSQRKDGVNLNMWMIQSLERNVLIACTLHTMMPMIKMIVITMTRRKKTNPFL